MRIRLVQPAVWTLNPQEVQRVIQSFISQPASRKKVICRVCGAVFINEKRALFCLRDPRGIVQREGFCHRSCLPNPRSQNAEARSTKHLTQRNEDSWYALTPANR